MAEYVRGLDISGNDRSGHNKTEKAARSRLPGVDFEAMNFEQRRAPYGKNTRSEESEFEDAGNRSGPGGTRDEA